MHYFDDLDLICYNHNPDEHHGLLWYLTRLVLQCCY